MSRFYSCLMLVGLTCFAVVPSGLAQAQGESPTLSGDTSEARSKAWPLRLHILAVDDAHRTVRMQPNWSSASLPDVSSGEISVSHDESQTLGGGDDDFSGAGRADLVTPPNGTVGVNFTYEGCSRLRVPPGFQGLEARWTKPGSKLQVMIPTEAGKDGPVPPQRCTLNVVQQPFVYLRLRNGAILRVSREAYDKKPSLRVFLSGGSETLQRRAATLSTPPL